MQVGMGCVNLNYNAFHHTLPAYELLIQDHTDSHSLSWEPSVPPHSLPNPSPCKVCSPSLPCVLLLFPPPSRLSSLIGTLDLSEQISPQAICIHHLPNVQSTSLGDCKILWKNHFASRKSGQKSL